MKRSANENLVVAESREVRRLQDAGLYAWAEECLVPAGQSLAEYGSGNFPIEDVSEILFHGIVRLEVTSRRHCIAHSAIVLVVVWIPVSVAYLLDQICGYSITFDGQ